MTDGVAEQVEQVYAEAMLRGASEFLAGLAPRLALLTDTLEADMLCSVLAAPSESGDDAAALMGFQQIIARVVVAVSAAPSVEGVAFLRAAEAFVPSDLGDVVETAVASAVSSGVPEPGWSHRPPLVVEDCRLWSGPAADIVSVTFGGGPFHVLAAHIDHSTGGIFDLDAYADPAEDPHADQVEAFGPAGFVESPLTVAEAASRLADALSVPVDRREAGDDRVHQAVALRQLLRVRVAAMTASR